VVAVSTPEDKLLAGKQVFVKVVQNDVKAVFDETRAALEPRLDADESVAALLPDGTRIGSVKRSKAKRTPVVTDEAAVLAWVRENRPEEIVESVRPAFVEYLKGQARKHGEAVYEATGEIVPGVEMREGAPSYLPQPDPAMVPVIRQKLAELIGGGLLALPGAEPAAPDSEDVPERVVAAEKRREMRDLIDRSSLGEHAREVSPSGFAACRCGQWEQGPWDEHLADMASRDMHPRRRSS
jgi:hypothetical protein